MMRPSTFAAFALGLFACETLSQNTTTLTLDEVDSQVSSFLQLVQNGTISTRGTSLRSVHPSGCALACSFLNFALPGQISYPGSATYESENIYWSQQQALEEPTCRYSPNSAFDVSVGVLTLQVTQCEFAVKSGGHAAFAGASNIENGLTIDLINLNQITVSADKTQTSIGPGNVWYDVYTKLDPMGLSVIGGRVSAIGVGGITLGGGISFFSGRYGWACDNVNTYEVVFADGTIQEVSYSSPYSDLYFALRGGGNNFGIVTRFDVVTFPQGDLWAGSETFIYNNETAAAINNAFYWLGINAPSDPYAQVILAYAYAQAEDLYVIASDLQYGKPVADPPILQNFTAVPGAIANTIGFTNLSALTVEFNNSNPGGFRQTYWALMVGNSPTLMADIVAIFMEETDLVKDAAGLVSSCVFQPITTDMTSHMTKNGGNALGLAGQGPLNLVNIDLSWSDAADDTRILAAAGNMVSRSNTTAYAQGLGNKYLYQNYASFEQDVFPSYGAANLAKLRAVSAKYDPLKVWQKLQPGYFKVG